MVKLEVGNSYSRITGLQPKQEKELRTLLSYTIGGSAAFFSGYGTHKKSLLDKKGFFPSGLKHRVVDLIISKRWEWQLVDNRPVPRCGLPSLAELPHKPHVAQQKALSAALHHGAGCISMPTGSGKSLVIALIASTLNVRTLIVVPSLQIKKQLSEGLKTLKNVVVENIDNPKLKKLSEFDCLIIDEAHRAAAKTYRLLNKMAWTKIFHRFALTATAFRNDPEEQLLFESIAGQLIYKLSYQEAIKHSYIVPVEAYYIDLPKQETYAFTWPDVYSQLVVNNTIRNTTIVEMLRTFAYNSVSALCLVKEVKHGLLLSGASGAPFVHGAEDDRSIIERFSAGEIPILIATEGVCGEGIDTKACEFIILAGLGKAKSALMQKIGRTIRTYPGKMSGKVIIFRDSSHKYCLTHFRTQCKVLKDEYGVKPLKLEGI